MAVRQAGRKSAQRKATTEVQDAENEADTGADQEVDTASSRSPAVTRALRILRLLADSPSPMGVNAIARELDMFSSSCLHILRAMESQGFVILDPEDKLWMIGLGLITVARGALNKQFPTRVAQAEIDQLTSAFELTSVVTQMDANDRMVVMAVSHSNRPFGIRVQVGQRFPAYISATGRAVAACSNLGRSRLRAKFDELKWENPPKFEEWMKQVEEAKRHGIAIDNGNYVKGFVIYAAPVFEDGQMQRSIAVISINGQLASDQIEELKGKMLESASRLSH